MQGNLALKIAYDEGTPVRVCRAAGEGGTRPDTALTFRQYSYEGLYLITEMKQCAPLSVSYL